MNIILAHNFYSSKQPSGENEVVWSEKKLLEKNGNVVNMFSRHSDDLNEKHLSGKIRGAICTPWNISTTGEIRRRIAETSAEVVHVHNTFPLISPSIFYGVGDRAAKVLTLHNYRLFCSAAIPMRDGRVCVECLEKRTSIPALKHGCYRGSRLSTVPLAANIALHRFAKTWKNKVDAFIVLSEFQKSVMIDAGLPREKVFVKPNFYSGRPKVIPWGDREPCVVFAGRLSREKGIISLIDAWKIWGKKAPLLKVVGDGPLNDKVRNYADGLNIEFYGRLSQSDTVELISNAKLQILPSEWFEGFPMVVREAFAFGTPSAVSNIGPLPSIVSHGTSGIVFEPSNPTSIHKMVAKCWEDDGLLKHMGENARLEFESKYTEESNYETLLEVYRSAIQISKR
ncbi:glycosyltransferase family 4 protein [Halomonas sp. H33-56]|uniref:glycosyltransferase family 4 protein n=1 Tax=Halomonas sp. H33-56 TaxID=2950873 RepID=UPI0032DFE1BC